HQGSLALWRRGAEGLFCQKCLGMCYNTRCFIASCVGRDTNFATQCTASKRHHAAQGKGEICVKHAEAAALAPTRPACLTKRPTPKERPNMSKKPVPKKKTSKSKRNMRRSHHALSAPQLSECAQCGSKKLSH